MSYPRLEPQRYLAAIDADTDRLLALAERGLKEQVPSCPGWDVAEVVWHVAVVYEHKARVIADNAWPDPWPPSDFDGREEIGFLRDAKADLMRTFADHSSDEETTTFSPDDNTVAFWIRRMAHEVAVHRYDAELAHQDPTPIAEDLALDGVDENLHVMLAGPWWDGRVETEYPVEATVAIEAGDRRWLCDVQRSSVTVADDSELSADLTIAGDPQEMFLWLWGRGEDASVGFTGGESPDADSLAAQFRGRLVECQG